MLTRTLTVLQRHEVTMKDHAAWFGDEGRDVEIPLAFLRAFLRRLPCAADKG